MQQANEDADSHSNTLGYTHPACHAHAAPNTDADSHPQANANGHAPAAHADSAAARLANRHHLRL
ncbi:MAG: hypothetical protein HYZ49_10695 [Chloroflexi bacterium]|nr:hypothetical protein [Chloroflexota bacterium]